MGRKKTNRERDVKIIGNGTTSFALMIFNTTFALIFALIIRAIAVLDGWYLNCRSV